MNYWLLAGGAIAVFVAIIHSALGERLIFSRMRQGSIVPTAGQPVLRERHVRILWASWHIVSVLGCGFAAVLVYAALSTGENILLFVLTVVSISMAISSFLVLYATKGMHPGWAGLLFVAVATWCGRLVYVA